jgi:molybdate transport system regulatory protein
MAESWGCVHPRYEYFNYLQWFFITGLKDMNSDKFTVPQKTIAGNKLSRFGRHPEAGYKIQACVWIEKDGELYIGGGRVMLLERIDKLGSIAAAARTMQLTYSNAWLWINSMNRLAPSPLVERITGGVNGGHTQLTEEGHKTVAQFHELRIKLELLLDSGSACVAPGGNPIGESHGLNKRKKAYIPETN